MPKLWKILKLATRGLGDRFNPDQVFHDDVIAKGAIRPKSDHTDTRDNHQKVETIRKAIS